MKKIYLSLVLIFIAIFYFYDFNSIDKIYVINLERSKERWQKISQQLDKTGVKYKRFNAIDGYKILIKELDTNKEFSGYDLKDGKAELKYNNHYLVNCTPQDKNPISFNYISLRENGLSAGELGVWCSNIVIWHDIKRNNYKNTLILEDDVIIKSKNFNQDLNNFISSLPDNYDIAYLDAIQYQGKQQEIKNNPYVRNFTSGSGAWGAWAIIYSRQAIDKLLGYRCYSHALDNFFWSIVENKSYAKPKCIDNTTTLNIYVSKESLIEVPKTGSEICKMGRGYWQC